jgi:hypothetical protein
MKTAMQIEIEETCDMARKEARNFTGLIQNHDLRQTVIQWHDSDVFGYIELHDDIKRARLNVIGLAQELGSAVKKYAPTDESALSPVRERLLSAIDELERVTLDRGRPNSRASVKW